MKYLILIIVGCLIVTSILAGTPKEISLQTNLHCESCKGKIEKEVKTLKGIINTNTDVKSKVVTVKYDPDKVSDKKIISTITGLGYKADEIKSANENKKEPAKADQIKKESKGGGKESCCGKDKKK